MIVEDKYEKTTKQNSQSKKLKIKTKRTKSCTKK